MYLVLLILSCHSFPEGLFLVFHDVFVVLLNGSGPAAKPIGS
jgi:hypothetical protein